jgi:hypothetical protein
MTAITARPVQDASRSWPGVALTWEFTGAPPGTRTPNPRIKRQAHPCRESSRIVRSSSLAWIFALAAVHRDPAPSDGVAARVAASVSVVAAGPNRISSSGHGCPDRFKLDQPIRPVFSGRRRTAVNCNPNCNPPEGAGDAADQSFTRLLRVASWSAAAPLAMAATVHRGPLSSTV